MAVFENMLKSSIKYEKVVVNRLLGSKPELYSMDLKTLSTKKT